jgi:hypothetical protein
MSFVVKDRTTEAIYFVMQDQIISSNEAMCVQVIIVNLQFCAIYTNLRTEQQHKQPHPSLNPGQVFSGVQSAFLHERTI